MRQKFDFRMEPKIIYKLLPISRGQSSNTRFVRRHLVSARRLGINNIFTQTSALRKRCVIVCEGIYTLENEFHH